MTANNCIRIFFIPLIVMTLLIAGCGGGGGGSDSGVLYQYEYSQGRVVNTIEAGECDCEFADGRCDREYNGFGQLTQECLIGDKPSPCAQIRYSYDSAGRVSAIEYQGSCECEDHKESDVTVCDILRNSLGLTVTECRCEGSQAPPSTAPPSTAPPSTSCEPSTPILTFSSQEFTINTSITIVANIPPVDPADCPEGIPDNTQVNFTINDPDNTGSTLSSNSESTVDGQVQITLYLGGTGGLLNFSASVSDSEGNIKYRIINIIVTPFIIVGSVDTQLRSGVFVVDSYAYVTGGNSRKGGMQVIDITDPANPNIVGSVDTPGYATDIFVDGSYAYVTDITSGLQIIDISDPTNPNILGSVDTPGTSRGIYVKNSYAYVADNESGIQIIDISDPANPNIAGSTEIQNAYGSEIFVAGSYAYIADTYSNSLKVIDIANPADPTVVGSVDMPSMAKDVYVSGSYAYVAASTQGLQIVDITDPNFPNIVGSSDVPDIAKSVFVSGSYAFIADANSRLRVIDISDPTEPVFIGSIDTLGSPECTYVAGSYAYVANLSRGLQIIDISNL